MLRSNQDEIAATSLHTRYELTILCSLRAEPMDVTLRLTNPGERDALRAFLEKRECHVELSSGGDRPGGLSYLNRSAGPNSGPATAWCFLQALRARVAPGEVLQMRLAGVCGARLLAAVARYSSRSNATEEVGRTPGCGPRRVSWESERVNLPRRRSPTVLRGCDRLKTLWSIFTES
jgi:hypothetical protein